MHNPDRQVYSTTEPGQRIPCTTPMVATTKDTHIDSFHRQASHAGNLCVDM